ncbi:hypothetical protein, partial [Hyella patelloides]|uniref:hypothetical protein n=1 Tax=Hyella patelloides TaxID=1982969 RepID=UPI001C94FD18
MGNDDPPPPPGLFPLAEAAKPHPIEPVTVIMGTRDCPPEIFNSSPAPKPKMVSGILALTEIDAGASASSVLLFAVVPKK